MSSVALTIICPSCDHEVLEEAQFCHLCGAVLVEHPKRPLQTATPVDYGTFWRRFFASLVDGALVTLMVLPSCLVLYWMMEALTVRRVFEREEAGRLVGMSWVVFWLIADWIYNARQMSSRHQATLGKRWMRLMVTDLSGGPISFGQATGRHFAKFLSTFSIVGFFIATISKRRQALHDTGRRNAGGEKQILGTHLCKINHGNQHPSPASLVCADGHSVVMVVAGFYFYARTQVRRAVKEIPKRLGVEIQQSTEGFSLSKSEGGRTSVHHPCREGHSVQRGREGRTRRTARRQHRRVRSQSNRFDQIYGADFEYDPKTGEVTAKGEVHIDLEGNAEGIAHPDQSPPQDLKNPIHLDDQRTGLQSEDWHRQYRQDGGVPHSASQWLLDGRYLRRARQSAHAQVGGAHRRATALSRPR